MRLTNLSGIVPAVAVALALAGCGQSNGLSDGNPNPADRPADWNQPAPLANTRGDGDAYQTWLNNPDTIWDLFENNTDPNTTVAVNRYLWNASLDVLSFLPIETVDPFTGVIVTGYGTPPGGGRAYRATIYVQDPALDARSLKLSLNTKSGPVSADTLRAVEDAILNRARQLRIQDSNL